MVAITFTTEVGRVWRKSFLSHRYPARCNGGVKPFFQDGGNPGKNERPKVWAPARTFPVIGFYQPDKSATYGLPTDWQKQGHQ